MRPSISEAGRRDPLRRLLVFSAILTIALADWLSAPGLVVGALLSLPILLASLDDDPRAVLAAAAVALAAFVVVARFGHPPGDLPDSIAAANRTLAILSIPAAAVIALLLQRQRRAVSDARYEAEGARREAENARDLSRLLHSLLAHDVRAPLAQARQGFELVRGSTPTLRQPEADLLRDLDARLRRSLRTVDTLLDAARDEIDQLLPGADASGPLDLGAELADEIGSYADEARFRGKDLVLDLGGIDGPVEIDRVVLRQGASILIDNAIRHARSGAIRIGARMTPDTLEISVIDPGPIDAEPSTNPDGRGLGLQLGNLLVRRAGGILFRVEREDDATEFRLTLPRQRAG